MLRVGHAPSWSCSEMVTFGSVLDLRSIRTKKRFFSIFDLRQRRWINSPRFLNLGTMDTQRTQSQRDWICSYDAVTKPRWGLGD